MFRRGLAEGEAHSFPLLLYCAQTRAPWPAPPPPQPVGGEGAESAVSEAPIPLPTRPPRSLANEVATNRINGEARALGARYAQINIASSPCFTFPKSMFGIACRLALTVLSYYAAAELFADLCSHPCPLGLFKAATATFQLAALRDAGLLPQDPHQEEQPAAAASGAEGQAGEAGAAGNTQAAEQTPGAGAGTGLAPRDPLATMVGLHQAARAGSLEALMALADRHAQVW